MSAIHPLRKSLFGVLLLFAVVIGVLVASRFGGTSHPKPRNPHLKYLPQQNVDTSGFVVVQTVVPRWDGNATLGEIAEAWDGAAEREIRRIDRQLQEMPFADQSALLFDKAALLNSEGKPQKAYEVLETLRTLVEKNDTTAQDALFSVIFLQGVTALRRGETENCIMCRGESSCILPISVAARHTKPEGSRLAIRHFTEYLQEFPDDLGVKWLLNVAHMTLGEHPDKVDPRYVLSLEHFRKSEFDIGKFRDVGHLAKVNQLAQAGGALLEDFDNDGHLDIAMTIFDPVGQMSMLHNRGDGTFEERTVAAGLKGQLGGLNCMQTDYNNDGYADIYIVRGAWVMHPMRPSLLRNNRDGTFTDVTAESGLLYPVNSIAASWADYDNDGWLDLFVCCERQQSLLFRNLGNGTFEEVAQKTGLVSKSSNCKGAAWLDYDNDGFPDLFLNYYDPNTTAQLFHNNRDGTFDEVSQSMGIAGPRSGFSCWAWDFDNDGWLDIFATCYDKSLDDVVRGLIGEPHTRNSNCLYRNREGKSFEDVTRDAGLDLVFETMGSNFGDFDNDGFLDFYLGTGEPQLSTLIPNRMFKNVGGRRFAEITASTGTGSLQKGHGVACGDWDRDGDVDIFIKMGGAIDGDRYHNILFQNPGQGNHSLTVKLIGQKTNRAAIGARIKVVTDAAAPQTIHRHVSSGSSFGANPLEQTIGLGQATRVSTLEVYWPTSGTKQVFHDIQGDQSITITEFAETCEKMDWLRITLPESEHDTMSAKAR
jgi:hypothetical protein